MTLLHIVFCFSFSCFVRIFVPGVSADAVLLISIFEKFRRLSTVVRELIGTKLIFKLL